MAKKCAFKVRWVGNKHGSKDAVLFDSRGHSRNAINYPAGYKVTAAEKLRAERILLKGRCGR